MTMKKRTIESQLTGFLSTIMIYLLQIVSIGTARMLPGLLPEPGSKTEWALETSFVSRTLEAVEKVQIYKGNNFVTNNTRTYSAYTYAYNILKSSQKDELNKSIKVTYGYEKIQMHILRTVRKLRKEGLF